MRTVIGLDPGVSGGIAYGLPDGTVAAVPMPEPGPMCALIRSIREKAPASRLIVYMEQVGGFIKTPSGPGCCKACGQEKAGAKCHACGLPIVKLRQPGHAMFTFGKNTGRAEGALLMAGAEIIEVNPRTWQKPLFLGRVSGPDRKRALADAARKRFPRINVTLKTADALLLLAYGMLCTGETAAPMPSAGPQGELPLPDARDDALAAVQCGLDDRAAAAPLDPGTRRYIGFWAGVPCVIESDALGDNMIRKATPSDMLSYPTK